MMHSSGIVRRHFLKSTLGLAVGFVWAPELLSQTPANNLPPGSLANNRMLDSWLHIEPEGKVTVLAGKVEFGQGITTALMQIVADELEIDLSRIVMIPTTTGISPNEGVTSGSQSIEYGGIALRYAAADARRSCWSKPQTNWTSQFLIFKCAMEIFKPNQVRQLAIGLWQISLFFRSPWLQIFR
jgi:hypothetical protein